MNKKEQIMDILMNYLPKEGVSKTRDRLVELLTPSVDAEKLTATELDTQGMVVAREDQTTKKEKSETRKG